jgi:hypothetical protein
VTRSTMPGRLWSILARILRWRTELLSRPAELTTSARFVPQEGGWQDPVRCRGTAKWSVQADDALLRRDAGLRFNGRSTEATDAQATGHDGRSICPRSSSQRWFHTQ